MNDVVGIGLAGGQGTRARPLTLEAADYIRSKATMCFAGRPLIEWQLMGLQDQGVDDFYIIVNGRENRSQIKDVIGHGEALGAQVRYSRSRMDQHNTGSGDATLCGIAHWGLNELALVFPDRFAVRVRPGRHGARPPRQRGAGDGGQRRAVGPRRGRQVRHDGR